MTEEIENGQGEDGGVEAGILASQVVGADTSREKIDGHASARASTALSTAHALKPLSQFGRPLDDTEVDKRAASIVPTNKTKRAMGNECFLRRLSFTCLFLSFLFFPIRRLFCEGHNMQPCQPRDCSSALRRPGAAAEERGVATEAVQCHSLWRLRVSARAAACQDRVVYALCPYSVWRLRQFFNSL